MKKMNEEQLELLAKLRAEGKTWDEIAPSFPGFTSNALRKTFYRNMEKPELKVKLNPEVAEDYKVLVLDIELLPMELWGWGLFDQNFSLDMVKEDWSILSFSAKWLGAPADQVMYYDTSKEDNIRDDSKLLKIIHSLLDECSATLTQNGIKFDLKKLNSRFIKHGMTPPSSYRNIDTLRIAKKHFGFTSNKLAYMTELLNTKYKKLDHGDFAGFKLWKECMKGNPKAFSSMKEYNIYDVLALEELYMKLAPWDKTIRWSAFHENTEERCSCGNTDIRKNGYILTNIAKYQRYTCSVCKKEYRDPKNLMTPLNKGKLR